MAHLNIYLSREREKTLRQHLDEIARRDNRSLSYIVEEALVKFVQDTKDDPRVEFLTVSVDEDWKVVDAWLKERGISGLPVALDPKGAIADRYGTTGYPETFFIAPSGEVVQQVVGAADWGKPQVRTFAAEFSRASAPATPAN